MSVLRSLYHDLDLAAKGGEEVTLATLGKQLTVDAGLFESMKAFLSAGIKISEVAKREPKPRPLPKQRTPSPASKSKSEDLEDAFGEDLGVGMPLGSEDEDRGSPSASASLGVFVESHSRDLRRSSMTVEFEEPDCQSVFMVGQMADGPRVAAEAWYEPSGIKFMVVFDRFEDSVRDFLNGLFQNPYILGLDSLTLRNQRVIFSTAKTKFRTKYARVRLQPGINVVFDAKPSAGLARLIETDSPGKILSFFGVLPEDLNSEIVLFSAPLFKIRSESLLLTRGFIRMSGGPRTIGGEVDDEDGGFRVLNVTLRGTCTIGEEKRSLYAPIVADHELLQMRFSEGDDFVAEQSEFDPLMGGNSAWRDALGTRMKFGSCEAALRKYHRNIDMATGNVVSVDCMLEMPAGLIQRDEATLHFSVLHFNWVVGFPHAGDDAQIHVSGRGTANVSASRARVMLKNARVTIELLPTFVHTATMFLATDSIPKIADAFGADVYLNEVSLMEDAVVCCNLQFPSSGGPIVDVWPVEDDA